MPNPIEGISQLFLIILAFPIFAFCWLRVVNLMLIGAVETVAGIVTLGLSLVLYGWMCISTSMVITWSILLVVSTLTAFYPFAERQLMQNDHRNINKNKIESHYDQWSARPDNVAAACALASALYDHGYRAAAIALSDQAINTLSSEMDPMSMRSQRDLFGNESRQLEKWKRTLDERSAVPISCPNCKHNNPPHLLLCEKCSQHHVLLVIRKGDKLGKVVGKLLIGWTLVALFLVLIVYGVMLPTKAMQVAFITVSSGSIIGIMAWLFRQPKFDQTMYRPLVDD